jgi:monomeric sarcosine oxidase
MEKLGRRKFVKTLAAAGAAFAAGPGTAADNQAGPGTPPATPVDVVVVGAGVFGAWTAYALQRAGKRVLLLDQYGAANSRASSSGETRIIRMGYGAKELYTRWAWQSLAEWKEFSSRAGQELFRPTGVLWIGAGKDETIAQSAATMAKLSIPCQTFSHDELQRRFPQVAFNENSGGLYEPQAGALLARRAVQAVVAEAVKAGAEYRNAFVSAPTGRGRVDSIAVNGGSVRGATFVFACGPWLPRLFPQLLGQKIVPTRGEEFYFGSAAGDSRFAPPAAPTWIDLTADTFGTPDIEGRGFKVGIDLHGPAFDPDRDSRTLREDSLRFARDFLARRFPGMKEAPLLEHRVCQYENTTNEDFLIDRHPEHENVWLVGGGSGHGFKHGPVLGAYVAKKVIQGGDAEPAFTLASHADVKAPSIFDR